MEGSDDPLAMKRTYGSALVASPDRHAIRAKELLRAHSAERRWTAIGMDMAHGAKRHQATSLLAKVDRLGHDIWHSTGVRYLDEASGPGAEVVDGCFQGL